MAQLVSFFVNSSCLSPKHFTEEQAVLSAAADDISPLIIAPGEEGAALEQSADVHPESGQTWSHETCAEDRDLAGIWG